MSGIARYLRKILLWIDMLRARYLQSRLIPSVRCFSVNSSLQGAVKERLSKYINDGKILQQEKKDKWQDPLKRKAMRAKRSEGERRTHASLRRQKAAHMIKKTLGEDVDPNSIGPHTNDDLKYVPNADRKLVLVILGTTEEQLLDSVRVSRTVEAFLNRDQTEKAMLISKLAGENGVVGMNFVVDHFIKTGRVDEAIDLHNWRKKWGVPPNEHGLTTLFDSLSKVRKLHDRPGLTSEQSKRLKTIFEKLTSSDVMKPNVTHLNACLSALINCRDQSIAFALFEKVKEEPQFKHYRPNSITYTILFQGLSRSLNDIWASVRAEDLMLEVRQKVPETALDGIMLQAYSRALTSCQRHYIKVRGIKVAQAFFDIAQTVPEVYWTLKFDEVKRHSAKLKFDEIVPPQTKKEPTVFLIDDIMKTCLEIGNEKLGVELYNNFASKYPQKVDLQLVHRYMKSLRKINRKTSGEVLVLFYRNLLKNKEYSHIKTTDETIFKVFDGIHSQIHSTLHRENFETRTPERCIHFFHLLESFMELTKDKIRTRGYTGYLRCVHRLVLGPDEKAVVRNRISHIKKFMEGSESNSRGTFSKDLKVAIGNAESLYYSSSPKPKSRKDYDDKFGKTASELKNKGKPHLMNL